MSSPNDPSDQSPQTPQNGGFTTPGGARGAADSSSGGPSYGAASSSAQGYSGQGYGGQGYDGRGHGDRNGYGQGGNQPGSGGRPPYGTPTGGTGSSPGANRFGLAALIIGCVSLVLAFVPIINYVSGILALVGLVLGIVGLVIKNRTRGLAIGGVITSGLAIVLSIVLAVVYTFGFASTVIDEITDRIPGPTVSPVDPFTPEAGVPTPGVPAPGEEERTVEVVYEVSGEASDATIVYLSVTAADAANDIETLSGQALPWTEDFEATVGGGFAYTTFNITATNGVEDEGPISCRITVDGVVVAEDTSEGASGIVSCTSSDVVG
ncbi:MmpS family transport accessory protein [Labedella endophytica]|uniref:DUF4190 domain-containing protein n=1 Tax=Labedella endophytica TaxID=1523160 RepID=A0A3S0VEK9_9MICO|nr:MmpS family transport accessory protein [Labedella endophytica]RUQ98990.1 hypothetical protein ELQ94_11735 [Labedella endophytica]